MAAIKCPFCSTDAESIPYAGEPGIITCCKCPVCGHYCITEDGLETLGNKTADYRLSAWIREHQEFKRKSPKITVYLLDKIFKNLPTYKPSEKQILLLRAIERRTDYPGGEVIMAKEDYPLAWAKNADELSFLLKALAGRNLIFLDEERLKVGIVRTIILVDGWDYLDKHSLVPAFTNQAFVAMSFDKELEPVWKNGIKPAVEKAGYKPHRVDKEPHIDRIDAKVITDIKDSIFLVADVTQQKQGVYFEAGYALALKIPVIWSVREDELDNVHFDTRQYNHIVWKSPVDLEEQLYNVICAVIGKRKVAQEND